MGIIAVLPGDVPRTCTLTSKLITESLGTTSLISTARILTESLGRGNALVIPKSGKSTATNSAIAPSSNVSSMSKPDRPVGAVDSITFTMVSSFISSSALVMVTFRVGGPISGDGVGVGVGDGVGVGVGVGVGLGVGVGVGNGVGVGVEAVSSDEYEGGVGVSDGIGVGVGLSSEVKPSLEDGVRVGNGVGVGSSMDTEYGVGVGVVSATP